jgi:DNA-binding transcriptional ArsR family regulator
MDQEIVVIMDDTKFARLLERKYAQLVRKEFLDAEGYSYAFSALRDEVNSIIVDDSRGSKEPIREGEYSPASLNSLLSAAKEAGIVTKYLNEDGKVRWRLRPSRLSRSQIDEIRSRNSTNKTHIDHSGFDHYRKRHTDSTSN